MTELAGFLNLGDWLVRGGKHLRRTHAKSGAAIGYLGEFGKTISRAYSEKYAPYPLDEWFFLAHRPLFTWLSFGGIHAIACAMFSLAVISDARACILIAFET